MDYQLLVDLHLRNPRQGPGGPEQTAWALGLSGLPGAAGPLQIADVGCGTGASALQLAAALNAEITAVDLFPQFLEVLTANAQPHGLTQKIRPLLCSMDDLPFGEESLDAIWSEGAIYNIGFENGVDYWRRFLKPGGILAVTDITWLTEARPDEVTAHWFGEYPEIATPSENINILEAQDFVLKGYFPLPPSCWTNNYYAPLANGFAPFLERHNSDAARAVVAKEQQEIALYNRFGAYYSYGFYIAQKA